MRILLTGVNGQVGSALRAPLVSLGTVLAVDRSSLDLSCPDMIAGFLDAAKPDLIINPAAYTAVDQAEDEKELAYLVNAASPRAMALWAASHRVPLLHFSTDYVFDGSGERPWREDDPTKPLSVYGASKLAGEIAIRESGASHLIVRTSWVYASKGKNFLNTVMRLARERSELRIVADQVGAPTSANSLAAGTMALLSGQGGEPLKQAPHHGPVKYNFHDAGGVVHMCASGETSWHGFACAIVEGLQRRGERLAVRNIAAIETKDFPTRAARPGNSRLDMARLKSTAGLVMPDWREGLDFELDQRSWPALGVDPNARK
jgi:dTDP-4-dehydrorhamnose reductase